MAKFRSILPPINEEQIKLSRLLPRVVSPSSFFPSVEIVRSVFPLDVHMCAIFHPLNITRMKKKEKKKKGKKTQADVISGLNWYSNCRESRSRTRRPDSYFRFRASPRSYNAIVQWSVPSSFQLLPLFINNLPLETLWM